MFGRVKTEVLIVGAGPVGLLAALELTEQGIPVEIIDEQWRAAGHSYALALHAGSLHLLDRLGLAEAAIARGHGLTTLSVFEEDERRAALRLGLSESRYPFVLSLPQSALESLLSERLERAGVHVRWNHRLASLEPSADGCVARVDRLAKESTGYGVAHTDWVIDATKEFRASYVIGADGHRSMVRRALGATFDEIGPSQVFAVFECASDGATHDQPCLVVHGTTVNAMWPLNDGRARWSLERTASMAEAEHRFKSRLTTQMGERYFPYLGEDTLRAMLIERAPWFPALRGLDWSIEVRFERRLSSLAGRDRVWLAGDALHTTAPAGMQSMNSGLREASTLASCIAAARKDGADIRAFEEYGRQTMADWRFLLGRSGGLMAGRDTSSFASQNAARLLPCLPGLGDELESLAGQLRLSVER